MATTPSVPASAPPNPKRWWFGVLLSPVAWTLVAGVGYVVTARECSPLVGAGTRQVRITQLVICAVGLVMAVGGLWIALRHRRALGVATSTSDAPSLGRARFMAASGILLSVLFIGGIVLMALSALFLDVCERAR